MQDLSIKWGETLPFFITSNVTNAASGTLMIKKVGGDFTFSKSSPFTDGGVDLSFNPDETEIELGDYYYQLRIDYTTGQVDKLPDADFDHCCDEDGNVLFPILTITEALDGMIS